MRIPCEKKADWSTQGPESQHFADYILIILEAPEHPHEDIWKFTAYGTRRRLMIIIVFSTDITECQTIGIAVVSHLYAISG
jgi:hypothetical protein